MHVPTGLYLASAAFQRSRSVWKTLSALETTLLKEDLASIPIEAPIYIAGVARSGSTILLEMLNRHPDLTCHRYSDFPNIYTPYWHNWLKQRTRGGEKRVQERAHQDRIRITEESPEAMEEVLWMQFFPQCHDMSCSQVLDAGVSNPAFESFYRDHIRKLLLIRKRQRYLTKGNYNLIRLAYIQRLFPDARFLIPVRHPVKHIASLIKQDTLFNAGLDNNLRARRYLAWAGHFEFGPEKRPIHTGDDALIQQIMHNWRQGENITAWALLWNSLYRLVLNQLESDHQLSKNCLWLRYEDLCRNSAVSIDRILAHCWLPEESFNETRAYYIVHFTEPDYYKTEFRKAELRLIWDICGETAARLGYEAC